MKITIDSQYKDQRVDKFVEIKLKELGFSQATRNMIQKSVSKGIIVNDNTVKTSYRLKVGDKVEINEAYWKDFFENQNLSEQIVPQKGELNILYEDQYLIVIVKPKGLVVHPGVGNKENTLANYIKYYLESKDEFDINMDRAGIVHRLDKGVSGIMVIAKNKEIQNALKEQFAKREVQKIYLAKVEKFKASELNSNSKKNLDTVIKNIGQEKVDYSEWFEAKGYIGRSTVNRYKMEFKLYEFPGSKWAQTYILSLKNNQMLIKIKTGRMHQIRATLKYYGYHILGDTLYSSTKDNISSEEIMLESIYLSFIHPVTKKRASFIDK